jgi:AcrR family transcriptional regulator
MCVTVLSPIQERFLSRHPKRMTPPTSKRGRPNQTNQQRQAIQDKIIDAARELFVSQGYASVSMRRLASAVNCTPMTLYSYFERKIDILRFLWADVFAELFDQLDQVLKKTKKAELELAAISKAYVAFWIERPEQYRMVFLSADVSQPEVSVFMQQDEIAKRYGIFFQCMAKALAPEGGLFDQIELKLKVETLICALNGIAHNLITISEYQWEKPDKLVATVVLALSKH